MTAVDSITVRIPEIWMGWQKLFWENESTLLLYSGADSVAYRFNPDKSIDTIRNVKCTGRQSSSSPYSPDGKKIEFKDGKMTLAQADILGCVGLKP